MRTYIEHRSNGHVKDWRVIINEEDATVEWIAELARQLTWNGMDVGDKIVVYQSEMEAAELKLKLPL